jgi:hypothetical protein
VNRNTVRGCPKGEDFVRFCLGEFDSGARREFLDHTLFCPVCRPRLRLMTKLQAEVEAKGSQIPGAGLTRRENSALREMAAEHLRSLRRPSRRLRLRLLPLGTVASIGVIALVLGYFFLKNAPNSHFAVRGNANQGLRLIGPDAKLAQAPVTFSWTDVRGRDDFQFVLIDDELNTIYTAGTKDIKLRLPEAERQKLTKGKTYLWTVRALDDNSRELASASREFEIE